MKKLLNKEIVSYLLMFLSLGIIALESNVYLDNLIDVSNYNLNGIRYEMIYLGFNLSWILLYITIAYAIHKKRNRIIYFTCLNIFWIVMLCAHIIYCQQMGKYMIFSDLFMAGEGLQYLEVIFVNLNFGLVLAVLISVISNITLIVYNKDSLTEKNTPKQKVLFTLIVLVAITRLISFLSLGAEEPTNTWKERFNVKSIYNNYTDPNPAAYLSGFYEYNFRSVYKYFYNIITLDKKTLESTIDNYNSIYGITKTNNEYTGLFKDKNVIYVMMESVDSWVVDKETMPTLYKLQQEGLYFSNRYSPFFNGGQTINTEFALNSGLYAITSRDPIYEIKDVDYTYSLANMLKNNGYKVNSFHGNTGKFYSRSAFHNLLGYDYHYSLKDMQDAGILDKTANYLSDSAAISDDKVFDYMTPDGKFLSFFTTYSAHLEYNKGNKVYKTIKHEIKNKDYTEEELIYRTLCRDTDNFLKILIDKLNKKGLLDDTVIVLVTDHYVYGYSDQEYVASKKQVKNNRKELQNTPFIIWSKDMEHKNIDTILDTADILPTVLNLLGIDYNPNNYIGTDVFSENHDDFVWFSNGEYIKSQNCTLTEDAILTKVDYNIMKNHNILITNYYGKK